MSPTDSYPREPSAFRDDAHASAEILRWARVAPVQCRQLLRSHRWQGLARRRHVEAMLATAAAHQASVRFPVVPANGPISAFLLGVHVRVRGAPPRGGLIPLDPAIATRVHHWVEVAAGAPHKASERWALHIDAPPEGVEVSGRSVELAAAAALLAQILGKTQLRPLVASGIVECEGDCVVVDAATELHRKAEATSAEAPAALWLAPSGRAAAAGVLDPWLGADWPALLQCALHRSPRAAAAEAMAALARGEHLWAEELAKLVLDARAIGLARQRALWARGAARLKRNEVDLALSDLQEATRESAFEDSPNEAAEIHPYERERLWAHVAIAFVDCGQANDARAPLLEALKTLSEADEAHRHRDWADAWVEVSGSLHRVELALGELDSAEERLRTSLSMGRVWAQRARTLGDLAEVLRRRGAHDEARDTLRQAREALPEVEHTDDRIRTARFLRLWFARLDGAAASQLPVEISPPPEPQWGDYPQPAEVAEALRHSPHALAQWIVRATPLASRTVGSTQLMLGVCARAALGAAQCGQLNETLSEDFLAVAAELAAWLAEREQVDSRKRILTAIAAGDISSLSAWDSQSAY